MEQSGHEKVFRYLHGKQRAKRQNRISFFTERLKCVVNNGIDKLIARNDAVMITIDRIKGQRGSITQISPVAHLMKNFIFIPWDEPISVQVNAVKNGIKRIA